jgi:hypothetical protein
MTTEGLIGTLPTLPTVTVYQAQSEIFHRVIVKAGLWTLEWTVEWNMDWTVD